MDETFKLRELPGSWQLRAQAAPWWHGVQLFFKANLYDGTFAYLKDVVVERHTLDDLLEAEPGVFDLSLEAAQTLMDDLWASGVRPSDGRQNGETVAAIQAHLEDMRRLVFTKIDAFMGARE